MLVVCACLAWLANCDTLHSTSGSLLVLFTLVAGSITGSSEASVPTGSYELLSSTVTISKTSGILGSITNVATLMTMVNMSSSPTKNVVSSLSQLLLQGSVTTVVTGTGSRNTTATSTSTFPQPTNTTPCNNYPEFCLRKYSNITEVSAHDSPL